VTTLLFLLTIAAVAGVILAAESRTDGDRPSRVAFGLLGWLTSGNWPAKMGAALLIVGVGALLRFALKNLEIDATLKLAGGLGITGLLAVAAILTGNGPQRRAVSLALGGAAFGVAYLTAYSAFALFGYVDSETGMALLLLTAVGASVYAVTRSALSLAVLAMFGAFLAPAFAVADPGPTIVYGYYVVASLVTLVMVAVRGWRPLIHLSFVFTLAGGAVFAWTSQYYVDAYADIMQPAVLALAAIHVAMPIFERRGATGVWQQRLDLGYILTLPVAAALSAVLLADSTSRLTLTLAGLGLIWIVAAAALRASKGEGAGGHLVIGVLLLGLAAAARYRDLPWELLGLAFTVVALWMASRWSDSRRLQSILAGLVPLMGAVHVLTALAPAGTTVAFLNDRFAERALGAVLLMLAGHICRRTRHPLDTLLWGVGIAWAVIAVGLELLRADLLTVALVIHWVTIFAAAVFAFAAARNRTVASLIVFVPLAVVFTASWANDIAPLGVAWASFFAATAALVWLGVAAAASDEENQPAAIASIVLAPLVAGIWGEQAFGSLVGERLHTAAAAGAGVAVLLLALGRFERARSTVWAETATHIFALAFAGVLLYSTMIDISREQAAIALEAVCIAGLLAMLVPGGNRSAVPTWVVPVTALGTILWLQAMLLRLLAPPGDLSLLSIDEVEAPAAISLLWAVSGAAFTVWGHRRASRSLWVGGATLLGAASVKIVLLDIGSLGELSNILAVIAAGLVLLAVGWLAPMPPAGKPRRSAPSARVAPEQPRSDSPRSEASVESRAPRAAAAAAAAGGGSAPPRAENGDYWQHAASRTKPGTRAPAQHYDSGPGRAWMIFIVAVALLAFTRFGLQVLDFFGIEPLWGFQRPRASVPAPQPAPDVRPDAPTARAPEPSAVARAPQAEIPVTVAVVPAETACQRWSSQLPADYELVAGGAYNGKPLGFPIGGASHEAGAFEVVVNRPGRDVVLLLGAYEPSVWTISWSRETRIAAVWVSGYYRAEVTGLLPATPLLQTYYTARSGACPYFYVTQGETQRLAQASVQVLGRAPERAVVAEADGRIVFGSMPSTIVVQQGLLRFPAEFRDTSVPLSGDAGLDELIARRVLRVATVRDVNAWSAHARAQGLSGQARYATFGHDDLSGNPRRTFVVLAPMTFPGGLHGANRATFIVQRGVPRPTGDPGHSTVLTYE
jgi:hypothetical protein